MTNKNLVTLSLILASMFGIAQTQTPTQTSQIGSPNAMSFTIKGDIQGLMPGDILSFERVTIPEYERTPAFDVIIEKPDKFTYSGTHEHVEFYVMSYKPVSGKAIVADRIGIDVLIKNGTTHLIGTADQIYYLQRTGGLYDNDLLQQALQLEISLGKERGGLFRMRDEARVAGDTEKAKEYSDKIMSLHSDRQEDYQRLSKLEADFYEQVPSSEHTVVHVLRSVTYASLETTQARYAKMNDEAQNSNWGKILKREIDKISVLQPGNDAPHFDLTAMDGRKISLSDCAGSYVLIYHWGMCPGSLMIDSEVIDLYHKYNDRLKIIGITDKIEYIKIAHDNIQPEDKLMELELKPILKNMLAHPWFDAEKIGNNEKIETDYAFAGLPYFVFISPDGKIIVRGFHDAFYTAKSTIENE